jgi:hypothetical protein
MADNDKKQPIILGVHPKDATVSPNHRCPDCSESNKGYYLMAVKWPHTFLTIVGFVDFPYEDSNAKLRQPPIGDWTIVAQCLLCGLKFYLHGGPIDLYSLLVQGVNWPFDFDPLVDTEFKNWQEQRIPFLLRTLGGS